MTACRFSIGKISHTYDFVFLFSVFVNLIHQRIEAIENEKCVKQQLLLVSVYYHIRHHLTRYFSNRSLSSATHTRARASIMCEKILIASDAIYAIKRRKSVPTDDRCNELTSSFERTQERIFDIYTVQM